MPIYEYVCRDCGHELEKLQKLSDAPLTDCPACGEDTLKRKVSPAGFRLAGGGWYETDFKSDGKRNLAGDQAASADNKDAAKKDGGKKAGDAAASSGDKDGGSGKKSKTDSTTGASATA